MKTILSLLGLAVLAVSGNVTAETFKSPTYQNHNGSDCTSYYSGDNVLKFSHEIYGIRNNSNTARYISCPIVETEPTSGNVGTDNVFRRFGGTFNVQALWSGTGTIQCVLASHDINGNVFELQRASKTDSGWFTFPNVNHDKGTDLGKYSMHCLLPGKSIFETYQARLRVNF